MDLIVYVSIPDACRHTHLEHYNIFIVTILMLEFVIAWNAYHCNRWGCNCNILNNPATHGQICNNIQPLFWVDHPWSVYGYSPVGHTKRRATINRPRGNGRPHSQRCHRSVRSMFTSFFVVCASDRKYWRLLLLCCTNNYKCNTEWYYLYL